MRKSKRIHAEKQGVAVRDRSRGGMSFLAERLARDPVALTDEATLQRVFSRHLLFGLSTRKA
jgi:hypothetical protein